MRDTLIAPCLKAPRAMIVAALLAVASALGGVAAHVVRVVVHRRYLTDITRMRSMAH